MSDRVVLNQYVNDVVDLESADDIALAERMKVALSADHRVTDGAQGAQFLNELRRLLENPLALLA